MHGVGVRGYRVCVYRAEIRTVMKKCLAVKGNGISSYVEGHLHEYLLPTCRRGGVVYDCHAVRGGTEMPEHPVYEPLVLCCTVIRNNC
jgi:hypothetical protein